MSEAADATTSSTVVRGALWNAGARFAPQGFTLVLSVVAARFLGPDGLGRQSFIAFVAASVTTLFSGGLSIAIIRNVGDTLGSGRPEIVRGLHRWAWRVAATLGVLGGMGIAGAGVSGQAPQTAWILAGCACAAAVMHTVPSGVLAGAQMWRRASIAGLAIGAVSVPAIVIVLALGGGIVGIFAVEFVAVLLNLAVTAWLARRYLSNLTLQVAPAGPLARETARLALITTVSTVVSLVVWTRSEFFFLNAYSSDAEIAIYSIAFAAQAALVLAITAATAVTLPAFATLVGAGQDVRARAGYARAVRICILVSVPLAAIAFSLGPDVIEVVYGSDYADTRPVVRILLLGLPFAPLAALSGSLLLAQGRIKLVVWLGVGAAVVNLGLDTLLIPRHDAVGAALANLGAQLVMLTSFMFVRRALGPAGFPRFGVVRVVVVSLGTGAAGLAVLAALDGSAGILVAAVVEAASFLVLSRVVGFLPADDATWLERVAGPRLGTSVARALGLVGRSS